jgi:hypothetical protein
MTLKCAVALVLAQMIAAVALAQDVTSSEFSRAYGGEVELLSKRARNFSGSLGLTLSSSALPFASGGLGGYEATLGGTILEDRLWFFAAAQQLEARLIPGVRQMQLPERVVTGAVDARLTGQLGDRQTLAAFFQAAQHVAPASAGGAFATTAADVAPSSFLSLRYTGIVSSNMFFNASFYRRSVTQPALWFAPAQSQ